MANKSSLSSIFSAKTANETIEAAKVEKNPSMLWKEYWYENEVCCLFADSNVGKSILAVQIANSIAKTLKNNEKILYYDFELSQKQFEKRYTDEKSQETFNFSDNFVRVELNGDALNNYCRETKKSLDEALFEGIEENIKTYNSKILIVDNLSWLSNMKNSGATAGKLMQKLCMIKRKYSASILVLSHTPKRNLGSVITQNSLSGSKPLTNFFDAMFTIGMSLKDSSIRYVKQIKVRTGEFKYDTDHVELCRIEKNGSFLGFKHIGYSSEKEQLTSSSSKVKTSSSYPKKRGRKIKRTHRFRSALVDARIDTISKMVDLELAEIYKN